MASEISEIAQLRAQLAGWGVLAQADRLIELAVKQVAQRSSSPLTGLDLNPLRDQTNRRREELEQRIFGKPTEKRAPPEPQETPELRAARRAGVDLTGSHRWKQDRRREAWERTSSARRSDEGTSEEQEQAVAGGRDRGCGRRARRPRGGAQPGTSYCARRSNAAASGASSRRAVDRPTSTPPLGCRPARLETEHPLAEQRYQNTRGESSCHVRSRLGQR
jgi:hypothetical protein